MREAELLEALAQHPAGIEIHLTPTVAVVTTLYLPVVREARNTLFQAAWSVAHRMIQNADAPTGVLCALRQFDKTTQHLQL